MTDNKQIEEMAEIITNADLHVICKGQPCLTCEFAEISKNCYTAKALYDAGFHRQEWISVADRLPEDVYGKDREQITVLVYTEGKKVSQCSRCAEYKLIEREPLDRDAFRRTGKFYWNKSKRVTHWMPLPEAPKGENNG